MTTKQALIEARRRWGKRALIEDRRTADIRNGVKFGERFLVGRIMLGFFEIRGEGQNWEAAFADVDARKTAEDARIAEARKRLNLIKQ